jgi:TonB family protein
LAPVFVMILSLSLFAQTPARTPVAEATPAREISPPQASENVIEIPIAGRAGIRSELDGKDKDPSLVYGPESLDSPNQANGIQVLSSTKGVDFGPYLKRVHRAVEDHWLPLIPDVALPPTMKSGTVAIEFAVLSNGTLEHMKIVQPSGDAELDHAAWFALNNSVPWPALPAGFRGDYLRLRCNFLYNPKLAPAQPSPSPAQSPSPSPTAVQPK